MTQSWDNRVGASPSASFPARPGTSASANPNGQADIAAKAAEPTERELRSAIGKLNAQVVPDGQSLQLAVHAQTHQFIILVRHSNSGAVIRQIPAEDILRLAKALDSGHGLLDLTA